MSPDQYCQQRTAQSGSSFYYSFLFLPEDQRRAITALYAFCREVDDVVDECQEAEVARAKLGWWQAEVARLFDGRPEHPVGKALLPFVASLNLPRELFEEIIQGMEMDLDQPRYAAFRDLSLYCYRAAGVVGLLSAEIFGYEDRDTLKYAQDLGFAFQLTNILRDVGEDARRGRIYIPQDEMARFGVSEDDILAARYTPEVTALLRHQAERAEGYYQRALAQLPEADRFAQRSGLIMAAIYHRLLRKIEKEDFRVLHQRISLTPLRKFWTAWRSLRGEKRRHRRWLKQQAA